MDHEREGRMASDEIWHGSFDHSLLGMTVMDPHGRYLRVNRRFCEMTGYSEDELIGANMASITHPEDVDSGREALRQLREGEVRARGSEKRYVRKDGSILWVLISGFVVTGEAGRPPRFVAQIQDITQRKLDEERLRRREAELAEAQSIAGLGSWDRDLKNDTVTWSDELYRIYGFDASRPPPTREELGQHIHPEDRDLVAEAIESRDGQDSFEFDFRFVRPSGAIRTIHARGRIVREGGVRVRLYGTAQDVTERREAEAAMEASLSLLESTLESTADGILVVDKNGKIVRYNQKFLEMWGIPPDIIESRDDDEALQFVLDQLKHPDEFLARVRELYARPDESDFDTLEFKDGRVVKRYSIPQKIGGVSVGRVWSFRDVTERRTLEEQLRRIQKMEAVGRLAGGVAHDFSNLLTTILGYSDLLLEDGALGPDARDDLVEIKRTAQVGANIAGQLLDISKRRVRRLEVIDLGAVVDEIRPVLSRLLGENIELHVRHSGDRPVIEWDRGQLEQVILNLAVNARDAMPAGGTFTLEIACFSSETADGSLAALGLQGDYALLSAIDTGEGMDRELRDRVFEPFFTTKEDKGSSGFGLWTVYSIVQQHQGIITIESEPGLGTTFRIYMKIVGETREKMEELSEPRESRGTETVLVVEDEPGVREVTRRALARRGYDVLEAATGNEAISIARHHAGAIHLLLTDVVMPGMDGLELARRLSETHPETRILYMSGYPGEAPLAGDHEIASNDFLAKPFGQDTLASKVREVLDREKADSP
jgi:two-component system cell cycle sensor histidine kinase/response regulator CckA